MQVHFSQHARQRCKERNLDLTYLQEIIQNAPKCFGEMRLKVDDDNTYAVIHDINETRYVITVYEGGIKFENFGVRSVRQQRRKGRRRDKWICDFRERRTKRLWDD